MRRRGPALDLPLHLAPALPRQRALYEALRAAILRGRLSAGTRLPSSRALAQQLTLARGTVVTVFAQLASEGYLTPRVGSGTVVASELPDRWFAAPHTAGARGAARPPALPRSRFDRALGPSPFRDLPRSTARPFRPHLPAVDAFPTALWGRLLARRARHDESLWLRDGDVRGYAPLRALLAEHLRVARGVVCSPEQLVIVPSVQQVLDLVARLVLDPGDQVWLEDPGYPGARAVFSALGARLVAVPVDAHGLDVAAAIERAPSARLAYVTPGRQAPLGVTLSLERRLALLDWAQAHGAVVLEDDYDSEYRYEGWPVPALQGLDRDGVVVHAGTFSKTLLPSLRLAYAVLPEPLLERFLAAKSIVDRYTPVLTQAVLADFLEAGHFARHLRRMRELYAARRAVLLSSLETKLGGAVEVVGASAGLDVALRLPPGTDDVALCRALGVAGVEALALSHHAADQRAHMGLVLGFAAFSPPRLRKSVGVLERVLHAR